MRYDPDFPFGDAEPGDGPRVIGQIGQTLDGRVATATGRSLYINGRCALEHLHRLRAGVDAVLVGVGTVIADDPRLTVRLCDGASPVRAVIDPHGRVPPGARCLNDGATGTLVLCRDGVGVPGADRLTVPAGPDGTLDPGAILAALARRGLHRVLVEGGPTTLSHFLRAGAVDELHVMVAPKIFGSGREGITLPPIDRLEEALHPETRTWLFEDGDVLFQCDLTQAPTASPRSTTRAAPAPRAARRS